MIRIPLRIAYWLCVLVPVVLLSVVNSVVLVGNRCWRDLRR
jgi:hypothetical protein